MSKALAFVKKEFLELIPPTLFFLVVFHVVVFARSLLGADASPGISMTSSAAATVGALIVGKAILIADALPVFRWFAGERLILNVAWRLFLYMTIVLAFQVLEELIPLIVKHGELGAAVASFFDEIHAPSFWGSHIILLVFLAFYCVVTALIAVVGMDRFLKAFFGWERSPQEAVGGDARVESPRSS